MPAEVPVPRDVVRQILKDGSCPLHVRMTLTRVLDQPGNVSVLDVSQACPLTVLDLRCLAAVAEHLNLREVLSLRAASSESLQWAMAHPLENQGVASLQQVHDRIRARLWVQRVGDITSGTEDETIFETQIRSYADSTLRQRMETEMREALENNAQHQRAIEAGIERRMLDLEQRTQTMVEDRVQEQLNTIRNAEISRVREQVEQQVLANVGRIFQQELLRVRRDFQEQIDSLRSEVRKLGKAVRRDLKMQVVELRKVSNVKASIFHVLHGVSVLRKAAASIEECADSSGSHCGSSEPKAPASFHSSFEETLGTNGETDEGQPVETVAPVLGSKGEPVETMVMPLTAPAAGNKGELEETESLGSVAQDHVEERTGIHEMPSENKVATAVDSAQGARKNPMAWALGLWNALPKANKRSCLIACTPLLLGIFSQNVRSRMLLRSRRILQ